MRNSNCNNTPNNFNTPPSAHLYKLLQAAGTQPRLTWYAPNGERVELSGQVLAGHAIKIASLLEEEGVTPLTLSITSPQTDPSDQAQNNPSDQAQTDPSDQAQNSENTDESCHQSDLLIDSPIHWRALTWILGAWTQGITVEYCSPADTGTGIGPEHIDTNNNNNHNIDPKNPQKPCHHHYDKTNKNLLKLQNTHSLISTRVAYYQQNPQITALLPPTTFALATSPLSLQWPDEIPTGWLDACADMFRQPDYLLHRPQVPPLSSPLPAVQTSRVALETADLNWQEVAQASQNIWAQGKGLVLFSPALDHKECARLWKIENGH